MASLPPPVRTATHQPGLAVFAGVASTWVFVLVALGAFTTTIGAGMVFLDWPTSNGSFNPPGWLTDVNKFAEHSHRLSAEVMSTLTIILAIWIGRTEKRKWLRQLAYWAVGLVLAQALVGGLRVLLEPVQVQSVSTSLGQLFAMLHACLAQAFACTLIAIACALSRHWIAQRNPVQPRVRTIGKALCVLLFLQLAVAAVLRHSFAGLAIPTFPYSTPAGGLLPDHWDFRVAIHFTHRVIAGLLALTVLTFAVLIWLDRGATLVLRCGASILVALISLQIMLGAFIIWSHRAVAITTGHVLVGAATLACGFGLTWLAHRDPIEEGYRR